MSIKFTKNEIKRINRFLIQEINETKQEMNSNHSKEIEEYFESILKQKAKLNLILKRQEGL